MTDDGLTAKQRYYRKNKERIKAHHREYYAKHREEILEQHRSKTLPHARALSVYKPVCQVCGKVIPASSPYRGYCSRECERARWLTHPGRASHA